MVAARQVDARADRPAGLDVNCVPLFLRPVAVLQAFVCDVAPARAYLPLDDAIGSAITALLGIPAAAEVT